MTEVEIATGTARDDIKQLQRDYLFPCLSTYYADPLIPVAADGVRLRDADRREYLDLFAGILTTSVGHCHPDVTEAVRAQASELGHTSSLYVTEPQARVAERLAEITPGDLRQTYFTNSGTEAIETAITLACCHTGRSEIVSLRHGYSGRSALAQDLTALSSWRPLGRRIAGITQVSAPYPYRAPFDYGSEEELVDFYMSELEDVISTTTTGKPAAFIAETILGVGGYIVPPRGYFQRAAEMIRSFGGLLIIDEVQAGFGRTGDHWFGIEHWDVEPDIMVMAKGVANGYPVAATIATPDVAASWTAKTISTFGGNPVCMAAASATLDVLAREEAPANATARGAQFMEGLRQLQDRHEWIGEVRGLGLMIGVEIVEDPKSKRPDGARAAALLGAAREEGALVGLGGLHGQVLRIGPSLLITEAEVAEGLERLARACAQVSD
ncbi:MAG: aminotransferase class III-fold pyridoxal phosphate-dependent enzyme [Acidobacteria bacterium]|nr:aminotransferase class III-fold pyridoxal phosphate-dependent enzyme [Acidobacteriota bacterium]